VKSILYILEFRTPEEILAACPPQEPAPTPLSANKKAS